MRRRIPRIPSSPESVSLTRSLLSQSLRSVSLTRSQTRLAVIPSSLLVQQNLDCHLLRAVDLMIQVCLNSKRHDCSPSDRMQLPPVSLHQGERSTRWLRSCNLILEEQWQMSGNHLLPPLNRCPHWNLPLCPGYLHKIPAQLLASHYLNTIHFRHLFCPPQKAGSDTDVTLTTT